MIPATKMAITPDQVKVSAITQAIYPHMKITAVSMTELWAMNLKYFVRILPKNPKFTIKK